jgi:hypothetical protein
MTSNPASTVTAPSIRRVATASLGDTLRDLTGTRDQASLALAQVLLDHDGVTVDGMEVRVWLEHACRLLPTEARELLATVGTLRRLPGITAAAMDGRLSWSQTVAVCAAGRRLPSRLLNQLDDAVVAVTDDLAQAHPGELVDRVWDWVHRWAPDRIEDTEAAADRDSTLTLQPDLFGGGSLAGWFGTEDFSTICEALDAPLRPPSRDELDAIDENAAGTSLDDEDRRAIAHGRRLARRLVDVCEDALVGPCADGQPARPRPMAHIVVHADSLFDADRMPGWLLTTLAGGRLKASSSLIARLLNERGADIRTTILDDCGQIVGVGRRTHVPPDWLRDAVWARDVIGRAPGSRGPVRRSDLDHIVAWDDGGHTDARNLQPISRHDHRAKTRRQWSVTRRDDGTVVWSHVATGLVVHQPPHWVHRQPRAPD